MTDDGQNKPLSKQINATYLRLLSTTSSLGCFTPWPFVGMQRNAFAL